MSDDPVRNAVADPVQLREENQRLRAELEEAQEALRAIREGEVDAIVISGSRGEQVFSLTGAESVYRLIVETMQEAAFTLTLDGMILSGNPRCERLLRAPLSGIIGRPLDGFVVPEARASLVALLARSQTAPVEQRLVFQAADGTPVPTHVSATVLCQANGLSVCLVATDLSQLETSLETLRQIREQQEALRTSEAEFRAFFETAAVGTAEISPDGRFLAVNARLCEITGYSQAALLVMTPGDLVPPEERATDQARLAAFLRGDAPHYTVEERYVRQDGRVIWVLVTAAPVRDSSGDLLRSAGIIQDITARKQAETALRTLAADLEQRVQERTTALAQTVGALQAEVIQRKQAEAALQQTNLALRLLSACNEALVRLDDEQPLMQEICRILVDLGGYRLAWVGVAEDDAEQTVRPMAATGCGAGYLEAARISWADNPWGRGPTGTAIRLAQVQVGTDFLTEPRLAPWRADALARGFRSSIALPLRQGETIWGALTIYAAEPAAFPEAQVKVLQELAEDLAFGLQAVRLRTALRASRDRLRALAGELTLAEYRERRRLARVLHDHLQQFLVAAKIRLTLLGRAAAAETRQAATEIAGLVEEALTVSRSLTAELSPPILSEAGVTPALEWLAGWMGEKHGLTVALAGEPDLPPGAADVRVLLYEAVRELLFNVVKHAQVPTATVTVRRCPEDQVQIVVADTGVGFDPAPRPPAGGGFGLFSIRERLELVGGRLDVASAPGQGSRFTLTAPLGPAPGADSPAVTAAPPAHPGSGPAPGAPIRVLLVDNHPRVRRALADTLGCEPDLVIVGDAAEGPQAIALTRQLRPDVVLMDVSMPGMDGIAATRVLHAEFPAVRVIGMSAFAEGEQAQAMREAGAVAYLSKSDPPDALVAAIRASRGDQERSETGKGAA